MTPPSTRSDRGYREASSLRSRLLTGAAWSFLLRLLDRGTGLVRRVILARILAPHDFGLFGIALLTLATIETFTETGFQRALLQADDTEGHLDTAWTIGVLRGILLSGLLLLLSPLVAAFFSEPAAEPLVRAIALVPLLTSFRNPGVLHFQRDLDFRTQSLYEGASAVVNAAVAITYAVVTGSVWALVIGLLAGEVVRVALSFLIHEFRPRWRLQGGTAGWLFAYGRWVFASTVFLFLLNQGDDLFLAKVLGATALGYYQMAYLVISLPTTELTHVASRVMFPAYRFLRDNVDQLRRAYLTLVELTSLFSLPLAVLVLIHARALVWLLLGETWLPMVPALQIMAPWGFIRSLGSCAGPLFDGSGRPDVTAKLTGLKLVTLVLLIVPLTFEYGMEGTAAAVVLAAVINNPIADTAALRLVDARWRNLLDALARPFGFTAAALAGSSPFLLWVEGTVVRTLSAVTAFCVVYTVLVQRYGGASVLRLRAAAGAARGAS